MAVLYNMSLDELIEFDIDVKEIQEIIEKTSEQIEEKIDWRNAQGKKYPILIQYQNEVNIQKYAIRIDSMVNELMEEYQYSYLDAVLVLKDILGKVWKGNK